MANCRTIIELYFEFFPNQNFNGCTLINLSIIVFIEIFGNIENVFIKFLCCRLMYKMLKGKINK